ncbi:MAG: ATP-dependent Clp protease ATP-binding subunit [Patescibacteria group bacterium]|jgi:ATP-dependent Clp protease ATP-binding subunit ClpC
MSPQNSVIINGKSYLWSEKLDRVSRAVSLVRERTDQALTVGVMLLGLAALGKAFFDLFIRGQGHEMLTSPFWFEPNLTAGLLFFVLLCGEFVIYRLSESSRRSHYLPKRLYNNEPPTIGPAIGRTENIAETFENAARRAVEEAFEFSERFHHAEVAAIHLFSGCLSAEKPRVVLARLGIRFDDLKPAIEKSLAALTVGESTALSAVGQDVIFQSFISAYERGQRTVSILELFQKAFHAEPLLADWLTSKEITKEQFDHAVEWVRINEELRLRYEKFRRAALHKPVGDMNRAMTSVATPLLDRVADDLTVEAVYGRLPMLIDREKEIREIFRAIEGGGQSVILVGPPGIGKKTIIAGIAQKMVEEDVPEVLKDKRLVSLSISTLLSGANPSEAEERLMSILSEVARSRNIILVVNDIEKITGITSGSEHTMDLASVLADALARGVTWLIATTTPEAFSEAVEPSALGRILQKINIPEPTTSEAINILESKMAEIEGQNNIIFSFEALEKSVIFSDRYLHESYLPEKAIELAKEVALEARQKKGSNTLVTGEDVSKVMSEKTGIPLNKVTEDEKEKLLHFEDRLHGRVIGQEEAVKAVSSALRRSRAELRSGKRPIANFLFLGPTGVGKTELAKAVAEAYFGSEGAMQRFDMSEYQDTASIHRLIGNPDSKEGGLLTEAVRQEPFSIILLDELEKASPEILNLFLQVMDDGRLTDAAGRTIDFTSTILIATSNAGTSFIQDAVKANRPLEEIKTELLEQELKGIYRPEFLNRFDAVIVFKPLTLDDVRQIAYLMIKQVAERLEMKGIKLRAEDAVVEELAKKGFDPLFGARPLRRVIQENVENAAANVLLSGEVKPRDTIVLKTGGQVEVEKAV